MKYPYFIVPTGRSSRFATYMQAMSSGEKINTSEHRAVLHTALRLPANAQPIYVDGENIVSKVHHELNRTLEFARQLLDGTHAGITGKPITDLVHIGIGGSDLGSAHGYTGAATLFAKHPRPLCQQLR